MLYLGEWLLGASHLAAASKDAKARSRGARMGCPRMSPGPSKEGKGGRGKWEKHTLEVLRDINLARSRQLRLDGRGDGLFGLLDVRLAHLESLSFPPFPPCESSCLSSESKTSSRSGINPSLPESVSGNLAGPFWPSSDSESESVESSSESETVCSSGMLSSSLSLKELSSSAPSNKPSKISL
jgi:hypothetical protein